MKKIFSLLLSCCMMAGMAGCGVTQSESNESSEGNSESISSETVDPVVDPVEYQDVVKSPELPTVDETDYVEYYFDGTNGNDENDGTSPEKAKKTIGEFNLMADAVTIDTPTKFLFKSGTQFNGNVLLSKYEATKEKPMILDKYGDENAYPLFVGSGGGGALDIRGENIHVHNLEITNPTGSQGIYISNGEKQIGKVSSNIVIDGCYIHDIFWKWDYGFTVEDYAWNSSSDEYTIDPARLISTEDYHYTKAGIYLRNDYGDGQTPQWFESVWIVNNKIQKTGRTGIFTDNVWTNGNGCQWAWGPNKFVDLDNGWYPTKNLVVANNEISYIGGDAILTIGVEDCYIEHNQALQTALLGRAGTACAAIWPINCRRVYIQFNEAGYTHLDYGMTDGEGFDLDIGCSEVLFQYNYSHHNVGGGLLFCNVHAKMPVYDENGNMIEVSEGDEGAYLYNGKYYKVFENRGHWQDNIVRNNVFAYNGSSFTPSLLEMSSDCYNATIENNTIIMRPDLFGQNLIRTADYGKCGQQKGFVFRNNMVYAFPETNPSIKMTFCKEYTFTNNMYSNFPAEYFDEWTGIVETNPIKDVDPVFDLPTYNNRGDCVGWDKVSYYLPGNKKVFTLGMDLEVTNTLDILGKSTKGIKYIGAFCAL